MKPLLPVVDANVACPLAHSIDEIFDKKQWRKVLKDIEKKNPVIVDFISKWSRYGETKDAVIHSAICGILVYKLLESQAEADRMNEEFG